MREFETGANRDSAEDKPDIEAYLSPIVLMRYAEYMQSHSIIDGEKREGDNWQKLFGADHKSVCIKSLQRHNLDLWLMHRGFEAREDDIEETLCAIIFNAQAYLFKVLIDRNYRKGSE